MKHFKLFNNNKFYNNWLSSDKFCSPYIAKNKQDHSISYRQKIYDKEILYLESNRIQYINLNDYQVWNIGLKGEIVLQNLDDVTDERAFIGRTAQSGFDLYTINDTHNIGLWVETSNHSVDLLGNSIDKTIHNVQFEMTSNNIYINCDGNEYSKPVTLADSPNKSGIQLFSHRGYYNVMGRIYLCKLWFYGTMIYDLIPVRKNGIGYMYDKLSGKMFGNSGHGNLILGPDK